MNILVVSYFFPPLNSIGSHRPYSWARTWTDLGHRVRVVTTEKMPYDGSLDLDLDLRGIEVETVRYLPGSRPSQSRALLPREAARWENMKRLTRRLRFGLGLFADLRILAWRPLLRRGLELHARERFDFVIRTHQPEVSHLAAASLAARTALPWIADYRDLWHLDILGHAFRAATRASGWIERRTVSRATMISTISEGLAAELRRRFPQPVVVSYNGYLPQGAGAVQESPGPEPEFLLVHTGRLYRDKRDPEPFLQALAELRRRSPERASRVRAEFYGIVDPWFAERVARHGVGDMVSLRGPVSFSESLRAQSRASALLFFDWAGTEIEGVVSGKLFEYLGSRRPIRVIGGRDTSEAAAIVWRCGAGVRLPESAAITDWLLATDGPALRTWPFDADAIAEFSRRRQAEGLLSRVVSQLQERGGAPR